MIIILKHQEVHSLNATDAIADFASNKSNSALFEFKTKKQVD